MFGHTHKGNIVCATQIDDGASRSIGNCCEQFSDGFIAPNIQVVGSQANQIATRNACPFELQNRILARACSEIKAIVTRAAHQRIVASAPQKKVNASATVQDVVTRAAIERVITGITKNAVVACIARQDVVEAIAIDCIGS